MHIAKLMYFSVNLQILQIQHISFYSKVPQQYQPLVLLPYKMPELGLMLKLLHLLTNTVLQPVDS